MTVPTMGGRSFEIVDIGRPLIEKFSKRHMAIKAGVASHKRKNPKPSVDQDEVKLEQKIAKKIRPKKKIWTQAKLRAQWDSELTPVEKHVLMTIAANAQGLQAPNLGPRTRVAPPSRLRPRGLPWFLARFSASPFPQAGPGLDASPEDPCPGPRGAAPGSPAAARTGHFPRKACTPVARGPAAAPAAGARRGAGHAHVAVLPEGWCPVKDRRIPHVGPGNRYVSYRKALYGRRSFLKKHLSVHSRKLSFASIGRTSPLDVPPLF